MIGRLENGSRKNKINYRWRERRKSEIRGQKSEVSIRETVAATHRRGVFRARRDGVTPDLDFELIFLAAGAPPSLPRRGVAATRIHSLRRESATAWTTPCNARHLRRSGTVAPRCLFHGVEEIMLDRPFAGEFLRHFHFLQGAVAHPPVLMTSAVKS